MLEMNLNLKKKVTGKIQTLVKFGWWIAPSKTFERHSSFPRPTVQSMTISYKLEKSNFENSFGQSWYHPNYACRQKNQETLCVQTDRQKDHLKMANMS